MKIAVFSAQPYDRQFLDAANVAEGHQLHYFEAPLGPEVLSAVSAWCTANGTSPHGISSGRRSLEDVFLELTGRDLRA